MNLLLKDVDVANQYIKIKIRISMLSLSITNILAEDKNKIQRIIEKEYLLTSNESLKYIKV